MATLNPAPVALHAEGSEVNWARDRAKQSRATRTKKTGFMNQSSRIAERFLRKTMSINRAQNALDFEMQIDGGTMCASAGDTDLWCTVPQNGCRIWAPRRECELWYSTRNLQCLRKAFMKILAAAHLHHTLRADAARLLSAAHWRSCVNTEWLLKCYWNAVRVRTVPLTLNETHPDAGPRQNFLWWNRNFTSSVVTCQKHATVQNLP